MESCEKGYLASLEAGKYRGKFYRIFGSSYSLNHECEAGMIITISHHAILHQAEKDAIHHDCFAD
jgi:hypothetical protein